MNLKIAVDDAFGRIVAHATSPDIMRASRSGKPWATPSLVRPHRPPAFVAFLFHVLGDALLVRMQVERHSYDRAPESAAVAMDGIDVEVVVLIRQCLWLRTNHSPVLPLAEVILVLPSPARDLRRERLAADLD